MIDKIFQKRLKKINRSIADDYDSGRYIPFGLIKKNLKDKAVLFLATGGSARDYLHPDLDGKIVITQNSAPYYLIKKFNVRPNFWILKNQDSVKMFRRLKGFKSLDFSNTILLVPSIQSYSKVNVSHELIQKLLSELPSLKYSTFNEIYIPNLKTHQFEYFDNIEEKLILKYPSGSSLEALFIPLALSIGISNIYFSGVDQLETGHFWDLNEPYQNINGKPLNFVNSKITIENAKALEKLFNQKIKIHRCAEDNQTIFKNFEKVSKNTLVDSIDDKLYY